MRRMMRKPSVLKLRQFAARLQELNNLLHQLPGSYESKKIPKKELNKILFHECAPRVVQASNYAWV